MVDPEYVLILSGDHIYSCTYNDMLKTAEKNKADCVIAVYEVPMEEASRFGILVTDEKGNIVKFQEKPKNPISNLASMGIYIFKYSTLRAALKEDAKDENSEHDFGKNVIPKMLKAKKKMVAYKYKGYWRDVGTVDSLHAANMDLLLKKNDATNIYTVQGANKIYSADTHSGPQYIGKKAKVKDCLINQGAMILGEVDHCVISSEVVVEEGAVCKNTVLMHGVHIGKNAKVFNALVGPASRIEDGQEVNGTEDDIALIANGDMEDL